MHSWAQGDRLALAINFYDYGFDFWHPRTSSLVSIGGITGVEFPIQAYLAALIGGVFGRDAINPAFRLLDIACALVGFFYLFRLVFERTGHFVAALLPACFLLGSPVVGFYSGNYLPDPASLALSFVGYYYWLRFIEHRLFRDMLVALAVLTLAALIKTTTALFLAAVLGLTLVWGFFEPPLMNGRQRRWFVGLAAVSVGLIVGYFLHNQALNTYYQSWQFLAQLMPIKDDDSLHTVTRAVRGWMWREYGTVTQYRMLLASAALLFVFARTNLRRFLPLVLLLLPALAIGYTFFWMMGEQLPIHDYYVIASFVPAALLLLLLALLNLGRFGGWFRWVSSVGLAVLCFVLLRDGYKHLHQRMEDDTYAWLQEGGARLDESGVPKKAMVLILGTEVINTPLVYADRRGRTLSAVPADATPQYLTELMARDSLEYVLMPQDFYTGMVQHHTTLPTAFAPVMQQPFVVLRRLDMRQPW
ncbi:glycosyltransferase family 39 protein [Hymenobacter jeollabukensis]|nr:glycosyltransferase family 39 protein [Hymenobacter jeollabukensis]